VLRRLASFCHRRRRLVVVCWLVAAVALSVLASRVGDDYFEGFQQQRELESTQAFELLHERFPERAGDPGQLVVRAPQGIDDPEVRALVEGLLGEIETVDHVTGTTSPYEPEGARQIAPDRTVAFAQILLDERAGDVPRATVDAIDEIVDPGMHPGGVQVELGGRMFLAHEFQSTSELIGLAAAMLILLVAFGSLLAMGLPILTAIFGIGAGSAIVALLSNVVTMPDVTTQLGVMLGLGVGIDYALFIITRYRQGLHDGLDPAGATVLAIDTAGRAVLFAGATVVISLSGLFLIGVEFITGLGLGAASTVLVIMVASVTLVPALLGFVGRNIDKLRLPGLHRAEDTRASRASVWFRWSRIVQAKPAVAALAGLAALLVLALPFFGLRLGFSDEGNQPTSDTTRRAYDVLSEGFGPGFNGPLLLAARTPDGVESLDGLVAALAETPGVAAATPPLASPEGDAAILQVIPTSSPQSERTEDLIARLRDDVIPTAVAGTGATVLVGGITAGGVDISDYLAERLPLFVGGVLLLSFVLLLAVFRSVLVPVKAVVMNLLSIGAAFGVVVAIFQWGWLAGPLGVESTAPIEPFVPMMLFAIVFGLSMDYEVFLLSRIREEYDRTGDNALAVADGLATTARVITAAAAIMVTVFASFVLGDNRLIKLFGIGLASAILIDATLVRIVLVPATMELLGRTNWWFPRWLEWIPRLHVEAASDLEAELLELVEHEQEHEAETPPPAPVS